MSSLALVSIRSSIAYSWVGVSITWLKKLFSMHSRNALDCLQLAVLLFQQMSAWLKSPSSRLRVQSLLELEEERFFSRLPLIRKEHQYILLLFYAPFTTVNLLKCPCKARIVIGGDFIRCYEFPKFISVSNIILCSIHNKKKIQVK